MYFIFTFNNYLSYINNFIYNNQISILYNALSHYSPLLIKAQLSRPKTPKKKNTSKEKFALPFLKNTVSLLRYTTILI